MIRRVSAQSVRKQLHDGAELALLDVREQGVHSSRGHPFFACSLPLSHLESRVRALVPRCPVPVVVLDDRDEGLAERAAARLSALGYTDIGILEDGCEGWKAGGGELFTGVNVPSKAFGEFVEHHFGTPHISAVELKSLLDRGERLVVLDSRPFEEYRRMNIPSGIDVPGAELAYRVHDLAPDPETLVVVNCAGRTRSIIGCQALRNAGIPNRVVALKDGTMGWELAGFSCERGSDRIASAPSSNGRARALECAERVARRFGVGYVPARSVRAWADDATRTLFLLDVRTRSEFERSHIAGSRHAPGGQLVQATDEFVGVRNARVVLIDPEKVRAVMTASWLGQMGWDDVHVLEPEGDDGFDGWTVAHGPEAGTGPRPDPWPTIGPAALADRMKSAEITVVDFSTSLEFRSAAYSGGMVGGARAARAGAAAPAGRGNTRAYFARWIAGPVGRGGSERAMAGCADPGSGRRQRSLAGRDVRHGKRDGTRDDGAGRHLVQAVRAGRLREARPRLPHVGSRSGRTGEARSLHSVPHLSAIDHDGALGTNAWCGRAEAVRGADVGSDHLDRYHHRQAIMRNDARRGMP